MTHPECLQPHMLINVSVHDFVSGKEHIQNSEYFRNYKHTVPENLDVKRFYFVLQFTQSWVGARGTQSSAALSQCQSRGLCIYNLVPGGPNFVFSAHLLDLMLEAYVLLLSPCQCMQININCCKSFLQCMKMACLKSGKKKQARCVFPQWIIAMMSPYKPPPHFYTQCFQSIVWMSDDQPFLISLIIQYVLYQPHT